MATDPDPVVKLMASAIDALRQERGVGAGVGALARRGQLATVAWSLRLAGGRHWQDAREIRMGVVDGVARRAGGASAAVDPRLAEQASEAVTRLCNDDPRSLERLLAEALSSGDSAVARIVLEGALRSTHPEVGALVRQGAFEARPAGPWPSVQAAALALLVAVRHNELTADPAERIQRLSAIARRQAGGSGLGPVLRAQAAWLALRASGEDRVALTRILSDLPAAVADTPSPAAPTAAPASDPARPQ